MLLCVVLVAVAMAPVTSASWATTPDDRRYVVPAVSPNWVSYWGFTAKDASGAYMTGLQIWADGTTEFTDIEENSMLPGRRLYFATTEVRGLTLPRAGTAFMDCAFCGDTNPLVPVASLKTSYSLPRADPSLTSFQVAVVAVEDDTQVTTQGISPTLSFSLDAWDQKIIEADQLPATLTTTKPVAVFVFKRQKYRFSFTQLS